MKEILEFLASFRGLPPEQWVGLIAFSGLLVAGFALFVVLSVIREKRR